MNVSLTYDNFIKLFHDYCDYSLTEDEWCTIYDYFKTITDSTPIFFNTIKDCLKWYMDDLVFLFGDFETWDDYMKNRRKNNDI